MASGHADGVIRIWDVNAGVEITRFTGHTGHVTSVSFSPDGKTIVSGSKDNTVRLWDVVSGRCLAVLGLISEGWVAFTPEGLYKTGGEISRNFWFSINICRFEPGELDEFIPSIQKIPVDAPLLKNKTI